MLVPNELLNRKLWVCHRNKIPYDVQTGRAADSTNPDTWTDYRTAEAALWKYRYDGLSVALGNGIAGIDLDHCFDYKLTDFARTICNRMMSYTEFSLSGTGVHILFLADMEAGRRKDRIEIYGAGRFLTFSGRPHAASPKDLQPRQAQLDQLLHEIFPVMERDEMPVYSESSRSRVPADDDALLAKIRSSVAGERFDRLWNGDTSMHNGDNSAADMSLCRILMRSTGGDKERVDRLFRQSKLFRSKWDRRWRDSTYGEHTLSAIR